MSNAIRSPFVPAWAHQAYDYAVVDVFAEGPLRGNALAIFTDARGLSTEQMQALARETNLMETTFILPREASVERERGVQVRIFTVREELAFAGHPTLGTASWLHLTHPHFVGQGSITLDLKAGQIPVEFGGGGAGADGTLGVFGTMRQNAPEFGSVHDRSQVARALGLAAEDLDETLPVETVSTGLPFCIVPLRSLEAAGRLTIPQAAAQEYLAKTDAKFFYCITRAAAGCGAQWHARMQFYNGEDPATGSAAGCAIAYLVKHGAVPTGQSIVLEQGVEIKRPSRIHVRAAAIGTQVENPYVGGRTIPIATGRIFLP